MASAEVQKYPPRLCNEIESRALETRSIADCNLRDELAELHRKLAGAQTAIEQLQAARRGFPNAAFAFLAATAVATASITRATNDAEMQMSVKAPFTVVDAAGKKIFEVQQASASLARGAYVYSAQGAVAVGVASHDSHPSGGVTVYAPSSQDSWATLRAGDDYQGFMATKTGKQLFYAGTRKSGGPGGSVEVNDDSGNLASSLSFEDTGGLMKIIKQGDPSTYAALGSTKGVGLSVWVSGKHSAQIGGIPGQIGGFVNVFDNADRILARIDAHLGRGLIAVNNQAGQPISFLTESDQYAGGGNVTVADASGSGVFSAGAVGPASGEACVDRKAKTLHCLGVEVPLQTGP